MQQAKTATSATGPTARSTAEVLEDHLRCRTENDIEGDIARNYAPDVVMLTAAGKRIGHEAVREFNQMLQAHVPRHFEFPRKELEGRFAFIEWRAREPGRSVEDGADSFVIEDGKIVMQSVHYTLQETMPR